MRIIYYDKHGEACIFGHICTAYVQTFLLEENNFEPSKGIVFEREYDGCYAVALPKSRQDCNSIVEQLFIAERINLTGWNVKEYTEDDEDDFPYTWHECDCPLDEAKEAAKEYYSKRKYDEDDLDD